MSDDVILVDEPAPMVSRITMNRPEKRNSLIHPLRGAILDRLRANDQDPDVRVTIIRGAGPSFSAGYDLAGGNEGYDLPFYTPAGEGQWPRHVTEGWMSIWDLAKPVIAQVHGYCLAGGSELATGCDLVYVAEDAQMGYPAVRFGVPDMHFHAWFLGMRRAMEMMITGESISGVEAVAEGWANRAFPADELDDAVIEMATRIATIPPELVQLNKRLVHRQMDHMGMRAGIRAGTEMCALGTHTNAMHEFVSNIREKGLTERALGARRAVRRLPHQREGGLSGSLLGHDRLEPSARIGARRLAHHDLDAVQDPVEAEGRRVAVADGGAELVTAGQPGAGVVEAHRREAGDVGLAHRVAVDHNVPSPDASRRLREAEPEHVPPGTDRRVRRHHVALLAVEVVHVAQPAVASRATTTRPARNPARAARPRRRRPSGSSTSAVIVCERLRTFDGNALGTGAPNGSIDVPVARRADARGRGLRIASSVRLSSGSTWYARASSHQRSTSAASRSGSSLGEVVGLRGVLGHVVQLPHVVVERACRGRSRPRRRAEGLERHRLPALVVDAAGAEHLEVLRVVLLGRVGGDVGEEVGEARALDRALLDPVDRARARSMPDELEHGGEHVDRVGELAAHPRDPREPRRPADDARVGDAAFVDLALPAPERRVAGHRPAPRVVVVQRSGRRARRCARAAPRDRRRRGSSCARR